MSDDQDDDTRKGGAGAASGPPHGGAEQPARWGGAEGQRRQEERAAEGCRQRRRRGDAEGRLAGTEGWPFFSLPALFFGVELSVSGQHSTYGGERPLGRTEDSNTCV